MPAIADKNGVLKEPTIEDELRNTSGAWIGWLDQCRKVLSLICTPTGRESAVAFEIRQKWINKCLSDGNYTLDAKGRKVFPPVPDHGDMEQYRQRRIAAITDAYMAIRREIPQNEGQSFTAWVERALCMIPCENGKRIVGEHLFGAHLVDEEPSRYKHQTRGK